MSGDNGWLWWRDTDFFLDEDTDRGKGLFLTNQQYEKRRYVYIFLLSVKLKCLWLKKIKHGFSFAILARAHSAAPTWHVSSCHLDQVLPRSLGGTSAAH